MPDADFNERGARRPKRPIARRRARSLRRVLFRSPRWAAVRRAAPGAWPRVRGARLHTAEWRRASAPPARNRVAAARPRRPADRTSSRPPAPGPAALPAPDAARPRRCRSPACVRRARGRGACCPAGGCRFRAAFRRRRSSRTPAAARPARGRGARWSPARCAARGGRRRIRARILGRPRLRPGPESPVRSRRTFRLPPPTLRARGPSARPARPTATGRPARGRRPRRGFPDRGAASRFRAPVRSFVRGPRGKKGRGRGSWTLRRGLGSLAGAAARALGDRLRLGAPVARLAPSRGGWEVEGERFDAIVLAIPARAAAEVARGFAPGFADGLRELRSAPVTIVHLGLAPDGLPRGFGMIDADGTLHGIGTLLPGSMLPGRAPAGRTLVTCICGGARHPERAALPDRELVAGSMSDLRAVWGVRQQPDYVRVVRWRDAIPQYAIGHRERVAKRS